MSHIHCRLFSDQSEILLEGIITKVHLVDCNDKLLDSQGIGQHGVFSDLTILRNASLKLTRVSGDHKHTTISLEKIEY